MFQTCPGKLNSSIKSSTHATAEGGRAGGGGREIERERARERERDTHTQRDRERETHTEREREQCIARTNLPVVAEATVAFL